MTAWVSFICIFSTACSGGSFEVAGTGDDTNADVGDDSAATPETVPTEDSGEADSVVADTAPEAASDAVIDTGSDYPPKDPCPGGGAGTVVIGFCKPQSGDPGYLAIAASVQYPAGSVQPSTVPWKNPTCSSSTVTDCVCCGFAGPTGVAIPDGTIIEFRAGTADGANGAASRWYSTGSSIVGHYFAYASGKLVGRGSGSSFPSVLSTGQPNALSYPAPDNPDNVRYQH